MRCWSDCHLLHELLTKCLKLLNFFNYGFSVEFKVTLNYFQANYTRNKSIATFSKNAQKYRIFRLVKKSFRMVWYCSKWLEQTKTSLKLRYRSNFNFPRQFSRFWIFSEKLVWTTKMCETDQKIAWKVFRGVKDIWMHSKNDLKHFLVA